MQGSSPPVKTRFLHGLADLCLQASRELGVTFRSLCRLEVYQYYHHSAILTRIITHKKKELVVEVASSQGDTERQHSFSQPQSVGFSLPLGGPSTFSPQVLEIESSLH